MATLLSETEQQTWSSRLKWAKDVKKDHVELWQRMLSYYRNKYYDVDDLTKLVDHKARVNYVFSTVRTIIPAVYFQNPYIMVQPRRMPEDSAGAHKLELAINYYMRELDLKYQFRANVLDVLLFGTSVIKIGYSAEMDELDEFPEDPELQGPMIEEAIIHDNRISTSFNEFIRKESPFAFRISPCDFVIDPDARTINEAAWCAHRTIQHLDIVRKNKWFHNTDGIHASSVVDADKYLSGSDSEDRKDQSDGAKEDFDRVVIWEIWDKKSETVIWKTEDENENALRVESWPDLYQMDGFPFEVLQFEEDPERFWCIPMVAQIEDQVRCINEITSKQIDHIRRFNRKYEVTERFASNAENLEGLKNPADGAIFKVTQIGADVAPLTDAPLSPDIYQSLGEQRSELYEISGVSDYIRGQSSKSKTATESAIIAQNFNIRVLEKVDLLEDFVARVARKMIQVIKQYTPENQMVAITGRTGNREAAWLDHESVQAEVDIVVEAGSTQAPNKEVMKKQSLDLYNLLRADPLIEPKELIYQLLDTYEIKDPDAYFKEMGHDPSEVAYAQLENLVMMQGQPVQVLPQNEHETHIQVIQAFQNDPRWQQVPPAMQQTILQHAAEHQAALQQAQQGGGKPQAPVQGPQPAPKNLGRPVNPAMFSERTPKMGNMQGEVSGV